MVRKKDTDQAPAEIESTETKGTASISKRIRTLVFISHDSRDADLAEEFANLLTDVSGGTLKSFRSSDKKGTSGIEFGAEWYKAIMSQLGDATDVVALLTQHSIDKPWILYETGVAKGKLDTNVLGVALGVPLERVSTGPFGQFQNFGDDEDSLTKLVLQLLQKNPEASPRSEAVKAQVKVFLENTKKFTATKGKATTQPTPSEESSAAKLFEEVKVMVRELPERVDDRVRSATRRGASRRMRRFHPMMFEEMLFHPMLSETSNGPAVAWLVFISALRDDVPWIYEVGMELYHALRSGNPKAIEEARAELMVTLEVTTHGPLFHEMFHPDDEEMSFVLRHLHEMVNHFLDKSLSRRRVKMERKRLIKDVQEKTD